MGTISGWVVGWADLAGLRGAAHKPREIRVRNLFRACLLSWATHRRSGVIRFVPSSLHIPPRLHLSRGAAEGTEFQLLASACDLPVFRRLFPNQVIPADDLGRAMVVAAVSGKRERESVVLENREITALASSTHPSA
jgi:hypothetical protein